VDWIHVAQDRDDWWALLHVHTVMKLRVP